MRLLNVTSKRLESFYGKSTPKYAILSHMWGKPEDEVLFKHIAGSDDDRREGENRKGYAKLLAACNQAIKDKWKYVWIDTCCIDKESSAELSEAINSMYAWYKGSEVCYAYLEDVQGDKEKQSDNDVTFETVPFEKSRWFSRGWTLQELIAPRRVVFYSRDWIDIGTKASLREIISFVTDIRVEMIMNYNPNKATVAERMSWAAKRQTTREEDIAYCLMGLLGVNMPLLYGEGKSAFRRFQEEIMKNSDDHSIFAWKMDHHFSTTKDAWGMLADSPLDFVGAGSIVRSNDEGSYPAYSMSNKGLQIGLPIQPINPTEELVNLNLDHPENIFKAILGCTYRGTSPARWVVIYLRMVGEGRYVRILPYWLGETEMNPNEADGNGWAVTSLLVPQASTPPTVITGSYKKLRLKILSTESGYTYKGKSLEEGLEDYHETNNGVDVFIFDRGGKHFGVVIGRNKEIPWMDIITEDDYKRELRHTKKHQVIYKIKTFYDEGGSRYHTIPQDPDLLCMNVSKDYSVDLSGKSMLEGSDFTYTYEVYIDIRRTAIQDPLPVAPTHSNNDFIVDYLDPRTIHSSSKEERVDWFAIFNPKVKRVLDVSLAHSFRPFEGSQDTGAYLTGIMTAFSPDGKYLVTGTGFRMVQVYNVQSDGRCVSNRSIQGIIPHCVSFSPSNSNLLAIGTYDGHIFLWDVTKEYIQHDFTCHQFRIKALRFSLDGRFIISVPTRGIVQILDITNGTSEDAFDLGREYEDLSSADISPSDWLFAGAYGNDIYIWDLKIKQLVAVLQEHTQYVTSVAFTPDGKGLVSGSYDQTLKYWDIGKLADAGVKQSKTHNIKPASSSTGKTPRAPAGKDVNQSIKCIMSLEHKSIVTHVAVSPDGAWIVCICGHYIQFWNPMDRTTQFMVQNRLDSVLALNMNPTGNTFVTYAFDQKRVQIWKYNNIVDDDIMAMVQFN